MPALLIGPLAKIIGVVAIVAFLIGVGEWHGRKAIQQSWDASIGKQAILSASDVIAQAVNTAQVETRYIQVKQKADVRTKIVEREVVKYVETSSPCRLSPEFERVYDAVTGLLQSAEDGLPAAADPSGPPAESAAAAVTDVAVLHAHEALVIQYRDLWLTYSALVKWVRSTYSLQQKEFAS